MQTNQLISITAALSMAGSLFAPVDDASTHPSPTNRVVAERIESAEQAVRLVQLAEGFRRPWAVAFLPDGSKLVTERPGYLWRMTSEGINPVKGLPPIFAMEDRLTAPQGGSQGGLLDIVLHPDFENNGWIYFTFSSPGDPDAVVPSFRRINSFEEVRRRPGTGTALARARLSEDHSELIDLEVLYSQEPRSFPGRHYGSRIIFPGDGTVIFSVGDNGLRYVAQDLTHPAGSMIRIFEGGGVPLDNPLVGVAPGNLRPEIFSFGHRNNQGLAIDPETGFIWTTGHGPSGGDLFYRVQKGHNYGWPQVSFGTEYSSGAKIGVGRSAPGVTPPTHVWEDSHGPSGLAIYSGKQIPAWRGNAFAGMLFAQQVNRLVLDGETVIEEEILFDGLVGRVRDVRECPQGFLYILTDELDGGLYRIEPVE